MFPLRIQRTIYGTLRLTQYASKCQRTYSKLLPTTFDRHQGENHHTATSQAIHYYCIHVTRSYAQQSSKESQPTAGDSTSCWNCRKVAARSNHMLCTECGYLQDVVADINYFDLLDCPRNFNLQTSALTRRFRQLQTIVHPDKYSNKSEREQSNSAEWSSLINKAYKTLVTPIDRGQYLLRLNGLRIPRDNSALDKEFLMEMMERNEQVEDAGTEAELRQLDERIIGELNDQVNDLIVQFDGNDLKAATATLVKMKYLLSLQKSIKERLQSMIV